MPRPPSSLPPWLHVGFCVASGLGLLTLACTPDTDAPGLCPTGTSEFARDVATQTAGKPVMEHEVWCRTPQGLATGPYHRTDAKNLPLIDGGFDHGIAHGVWRFWHPVQGFVASERTYRQGQPHGTWTTWLNATTTATIHHWAYGQPCGEWQSRAGLKLYVTSTWPACDSIQPAGNQPVVKPGDLAPTTTDYGWDGKPGGLCSGSIVSDASPSGEGRYCTDATGKRNGPYARWHPGAKAGKWVDGSYAGDLATGSWRIWHPGGGLQSQGNYAAGLKTGTLRSWHSDGTPESEQDWQDGVRHGPSKAWYPGGISQSQGSYDKGVQVGAWSMSWPSGAPQQQVTFDAQGRLHGAFASFFESGQPHETGAWSQGVRTGLWKILYPSGQLDKTGKYVAGVAHGPWQFGLPDGDPSVSWTYVNGVAEGQAWVWTRQHGLLVRTTLTLAHGVAQGPSESVYDLSGKKQGTVAYVDGKRDGPILQWYENGTPSLEGSFIHGNANGLWRTWFQNGKAWQDANFLFGYLNGPWAESYANGQPKTLGSYAQDKKHGLWQEWYEVGKPRSKGSYVFGVKVGAWQTWDAGGKLTTVTYDDWGQAKP